MASVTLRNIRKSYDSLEVIHGVDLTIDDGTFLVLLGPSGCGKSTLLRMVAGLEPITSGEVLIGGKVVNRLHPKDRNTAMVFQNYALYAHMRVFDNMAFSMQLKGVDKAEIRRKVAWASSILGLDPYLQRYPRELSGGQRQRVAMGRALVRDPAAFLFDEPLSNLDAKLRAQMRTEIKELHQRLKTTTIYVTHDQIEAMTMADRIVVMNEGRIEQSGEPLDLYDRPANLFVAGFLGSPAMNFLAGELRRREGRSWLALPDGLEVPVPAAAAEEGRRIVLGIRPEHLQLAPSGEGLAATVVVIEPTGAETHLFGSLAGSNVCAVFHSRQRARPGEQIWLRAEEEQMHLFDAVTGGRLAA